MPTPEIEFYTLTLYPPYDATYGSGTGAEAEMCLTCGALIGDRFRHCQWHLAGQK